MTKGRKREHYQWNIDVVGEESVSAEAEIVATALSAIKALGLSSETVQVYYSSRRLLSELLNALNVSEQDHSAIYLALDKRGKLSDDQIRELMKNEGLSDTGITQLFDLLSLSDLNAIAARLSEDSLAVKELHQFQEYIQLHGYSDYLSFDLSVIRGLGYYTGIVFEAFDTEKNGRAIFGGGRYENLLSDLGGKATPAVGIGFGDVVISDLLNEHSLFPVDPAKDIAIGFMSEEQQPSAISLATQLRGEGKRVELALHPEKPKAFFSRIGSGTVAKAVYLGPDDVHAGEYRLKNLATRDESIHPLT